ncbi:hypothetical protein OUZ56_029843 [Daphnia magna]|uniref:Uncharacterized protein n=1 Tax=Daphnia magna TaxID=35525 RepID=A0ABR0B7Y5_9CRUS|nr:hypothetical protein OUZ56_029843 [Daphnia magna]
MRTRTADRRNCGLSPADWPEIFYSSPQFLRAAVRSPRFIRGYSIPYRHVCKAENRPNPVYSIFFESLMHKVKLRI